MIKVNESDLVYVGVTTILEKIPLLGQKGVLKVIVNEQEQLLILDIRGVVANVCV